VEEKSFLDEITVRPMHPGDEQLVNDFFEAMGGEARAFFNRFHGNQNRTLAFLANGNPNCRYWMAEYQGEMAGEVFCWDWNTSIPWLGIAVREELKGRHLGRKLIAHAQAAAKQDGKGGLMLTTSLANIRGQVLYETMGFKRIGIMGECGEWFYLFRFEDKKTE